MMETPKPSSIVENRRLCADRNSTSLTSNILMYYQNIGGINSSLAEYQSAFCDGCYDIYALSETWLKDNTLTMQLFNDKYSVYRQDRSTSNSTKSTGGGVLIAVRSSFKSRQLIPSVSSSKVEQLWITILTTDAILYLCVVYIPPDRVNDADLIENHLDSLYWVISQMGPRDNIIIIGDYNMGTISWQHNSVGSLYPINSRSSVGLTSRKLLDAYCTAGLKQMSGIGNENNRLLDLCFVSQELCQDVRVMQAPSPLVKICRHHPPILTELKICPQQRFCVTTESVFYDFSKADFDGMNDFFLRVQWNEVFQDYDANLAASTISGILLYAIDQFVPLKSKREPLKPAWTNADLKFLKKMKRAALKRFTKYRTDSTRNRYLKLNNEHKQLNNRLYNAYQDNLQRRIKNNPKTFWRYVNEQRKETGLPSTMSNGLIEADTISDIADMFRSQFSNVFTDE
ncbi:uncharacterized protein LOC129766068 [Toxorhynchites rutilus septentrionalis]|uniref:uncharacterized protein LOC129766068 n=1 Tax=Toxorhynchites rutilus septentrionalis TaxID=329112 RepID=UPI00247AB85B|nr:uncharacterized protein LOC129766068 [Toxorhynchites rutilus septentrionalis]